MNFDFSTPIDRRDTRSIKWDKYQGKDILPMWVADMDFKTPPAILESLKKEIEHGVLGYAHASQNTLEVIVAYLKEHYGWQIQPEWVVWLPGLIPGLNLTCRAVGEPGNSVLVLTPVYPPFLSAPVLSGQKLITCELENGESQWVIDEDKLRSSICKDTKSLLFCNPHNPVGRVYSKKELLTVAKVCEDHDLVICSDEVHCDLLFDGRRHQPMAALNEEIANRTITLMAPSKTFNTPGLGVSMAIISNEKLRRSFISQCSGVTPMPSSLSYGAIEAAYGACEDWRQALLHHLQINRDFVQNFIGNETPILEMHDIEATYLAWIDARKLKIDNPVSFFENSGVGLSDGKDFGLEGFVRLNFGCPKSVLQEGLSRMRKAVVGLS